MQEDVTTLLLRLSSQVWRRAIHPGRRRQLLEQALTHDHPLAWSLGQAVEQLHPLPDLRACAQRANARWAHARGMTPLLWADRVAASWAPDDERAMHRMARVQRARLERALRAQTPWAWTALREVILGGEPLREALLGLLWLDERDELCWLDERAQPRDARGCARPSSRALRLAHPAHPSSPPALMAQVEQAMSAALAAPPARWLPQRERACFGIDALEPRPDRWARPRWPEPLPLYKLTSELRDRRGWTLTRPEDNGWIMGCMLYDERAALTALWRFMDQEDQPRYGVAVYGQALPADWPLRLGLRLLKGAWARGRVSSMDDTPQGQRPWGVQPEDLCEPAQADPIFLSEVLRDLWLASRSPAPEACP